MSQKKGAGAGAKDAGAGGADKKIAKPSHNVQGKEIGGKKLDFITWAKLNIKKKHFSDASKQRSSNFGAFFVCVAHLFITSRASHYPLILYLHCCSTMTLLRPTQKDLV